MSWQICVLDSDYEIYDEYPFPIRRIGSDKIISEHLLNNKYFHCRLNNVPLLKHVIIANQFIPNPNNLPCVDHYNHIGVDNRIENLHWVSHSDNNRNKSSSKGVNYEYFDEINEDSIEISDYGNNSFENYYYSEDDDSFYYYNGKQYRKLHENIDKRNNALFVCMMNNNNKKINVYINKFKKLYGLK